MRSAYALEWNDGLDRVRLIARDLHRRGTFASFDHFCELLASIGADDVRDLAAELLGNGHRVVAFGPDEGLRLLSGYDDDLEEVPW